MFRAPQQQSNSGVDDSADAYASSPIVGALDATVSQVAFHGAESRIPNDRNPDAVSKPVISAPSSVRAFRGRQTGDRPLTNETGMVYEGPNTYAFGIGMGGAPTGSPDSSVSEDDAHMGFDPVWGSRSDMVGVGPLAPGNFGSFAPRPNDSQAHEVHRNTDKSDPRHDTGGYPFTRPQYDVAHTAQSSTPGAPAPTDHNAVLYQRPPEQFLNGRVAEKLSSWMFVRPFDQWASQRFSGQRVRPTSPPDVSGSNIDQRTGPHASMPIRNSNDAPETNDAYPGAYFAPSGMNPTGPSRNSWRLQPTPWDTQLVTAGQ